MGKGPDEGCSWDIAATFQTALAVCDDNIKDNDQITSYNSCMFFSAKNVVNLNTRDRERYQI